MSMQTELTTYIKADAEITALISDRYYPLLMPQLATYPSVVYTVINEQSNNHLAGNIGGGLVQAIYQFDTYSTTYLNTLVIKEAFRNRLDGINHVDMGAVFVESILLDSTTNDMIEATDESQVNLYRASMTFNVAYQESVPTG